MSAAAPAPAPARKIHPRKYWNVEGRRQRLSIPIALDFLSPEEFIQWGLLRMRGGQDNCYVSQGNLGQTQRISTRSVRRRIAGLKAKGLVTVLHRSKQDGSGRATSLHKPIWTQVLEDAYLQKNKKPSGLEVNAETRWTLIKNLQLPSLHVPIPVLESKISAGAAQYYAVLCGETHLNRDAYSVSESRKTLANLLHCSVRRITDFNRELKDAGWIRIQPEVGTRGGNQIENTIFFLPIP